MYFVRRIAILIKGLDFCGAALFLILLYPHPLTPSFNLRPIPMKRSLRQLTATQAVVSGIIQTSLDDHAWQRVALLRPSWVFLPIDDTER